jgi:hypothetical protein
MVVPTTQPVEEAPVGGFREVSVLLSICFHSWSAQKPEPGPPGVTDAASEVRVMVRVYNAINLPSGELSRAERETEKIFLYAGIQLTWTAGVLGTDVNDNTPSERWNPASLQLRIWTRAMAGKRPVSSEALGFCISLENGDALVLADAIRKRAVFGSTNFADLLGLAMAHELGHLLLQSEAHSVIGIMRARWTEKVLRDDDRGYLRFTPREAESMRSEVRRRSGVPGSWLHDLVFGDLNGDTGWPTSWRVLPTTPARPVLRRWRREGFPRRVGLATS